jgi:peptide/nickel transport system substrate-binding protein
VSKLPDINALRNLSGDLWNVAVDEHLDGFLSRRDFLRYASVLGLTTVTAASALGLPGTARAATATPKPGGTIRVGLDQPTGAIDPVTQADPPGIGVLSQVGEYLLADDSEKGLHPALAVSWQSDTTARVWTFKLRQGVKFHDGRTLTSKDVVATFNRLIDPASGSAALSAYKGLLSKGAVKAIDDYSVAFTLDMPNGNFPFYVSSDVVNAVILPADYAGNFEKTFPGTGPFKLESYRPKRGASFVRNPDYWGEKALPDRVEITFYDDPQAQLIGLRAGELDVIPIPGNGPAVQAIANNPAFRILSIRTSNYDELHFRTDQTPFKDKRVRQALALTIDREAIVKGFLKGRAEVGNDSPFAPVFPSTDPSVPQRAQNIAEAKRLLAAAGVPNGFAITLTTERAYEIPNYAVLVQNFAKQAGIDITLNVLPQDNYYGTATFGNSNWLDSTLGIADYGHRGTPDIFLNATLKSAGTWNAAHFNNPSYDTLVKQYSAALDLKSQRLAANKIQTLLLDETPVVIAFFQHYARVTSAKVQGVRFTANSLLLLDRATLA